MNTVIKDIFEDNGLIAQYKSNYIKRESQMTAADKILDALDNGDHIIVEGPCGFGKTFAYLFPIMENIKNTNAKCVIVTNGIGLSEQLVYQDLPLATKIFNEKGYKIKYALLKGRNNFLCPMKMDETINQGDPIITSKEAQAIIQWSKITTTGDFSELTIKMTQDVMDAFACVSSDECLYGRCPYADSCFCMAHRKKAKVADIIVTNYHILFSDYEAGRSILPDYDILVLDEAHEMANVFRDFTEISFSSRNISFRASRLLSLLKKIENKYIYFEKNPKTDNYIVIELLDALSAQMQTSEDIVNAEFKTYENYKIISNRIPYTDEIVEIAQKVYSCINTANKQYGTFDEYDDNLPNELMQLIQMTEALKDYFDDLLFLYNGYDVPELKNKYVYYYEKVRDNIRICRKTIKVGEMLHDRFFDSVGSCIMTSATLSVNGNFDFLKEETGLSLCDNVTEFIGESPFDLTNQQLWFLSENAVNGNANDFKESMEQLVPELIAATKGGILFLCTSIQNMRNIYEIATRCDYTIFNGIHVMMQGDMPNNQLIELFKNDKDSILVATRSFFTGIDVPGDALRCVAIDKFPFPSPMDPVVKRISEIDANSFYSYSIPVMITALKQAVGRGVRTDKDKCVISIMDKRIKTASYRHTVAKSFNYKKTATRDANDIRKFLKE